MRHAITFSSLELHWCFSILFTTNQQASRVIAQLVCIIPQWHTLLWCDKQFHNTLTELIINTKESRHILCLYLTANSLPVHHSRLKTSFHCRFWRQVASVTLPAPWCLSIAEFLWHSRNLTNLTLSAVLGMSIFCKDMFEALFALNIRHRLSDCCHLPSLSRTERFRPSGP